MSQSTEVLKMLRQSGKHGVENFRFPQARILCYTKRISELRNEGFNIITERISLPNGRATGVYNYTLIEEKETLWQKLVSKK